MEYRCLALCLWVFFVLFQYNGCLGCLQQERIALLEVKASILKEPHGDPLLTWVDNSKSDCCVWERVACNNTTRRVIELSLDSVYVYLGDYKRSRFLNASVFLPFGELQHLDLSQNYINGIEGLSKLKWLEALNLRINYFNSSILPSLGALTSLKSLDLSFNNLGDGSSSEVSRVIEGLSKLKWLEALNLRGNDFDSSILPSLGVLTSLKSLDLSYINLGDGSSSEVSRVFTNLSNLEVLYLGFTSLDDSHIFDLANMTKLKVLDLSWNNFKIPPSFANMTKLKVLDLSGNNFFGQKIPPSLSSMKYLQALSLSGNELNDSISGVCELTNLRELQLSENNFNGIVPPCFNNLTSLRILDLSMTQLNGRFPPSLLFNMTSLQYLFLSDNQFEGTDPLATVVDPMFQLRVLDISNCNLNTSTISLLKLLNNQYNLRVVDLSHNKLHGNFPNWLVENNSRLETLLLPSNSLSSYIHFQDIPGTKLTILDISENNIQGQLQTNVGDIFPKLKYLNLSKNGFEGRIPVSVGDMGLLQYLDLSSNNFSGEVPESLALDCKNLQFLILSNNRLQGLISPLIFNTSSLFSLRLGNNLFTAGSLPSSEAIGSNVLGTLDISQNHISGRIPSWIGNLTWLRSLVLSDNSFDGPIPPQLCNLADIEFLDLSQNHLSGSIPSCLTNSTYLEFLHLQGNELTGSLPKSLLKSEGLVTLDLNHNKLSGSIPNWLGLLQHLRLLVLKNNSLSGSIPRELCQLSLLTILDLSHNSFSGTIPPCVSNITFNSSITFYVFSSGFGISYSWLTIKGSYFFEEQKEANFWQQDKDEVEFITKSRSEAYKGDILNYMAGMDLSCNHFTGDIPLEMGDLTGIRALNLSHNQFTGSIPRTLSNLSQLESMDLSHNRLIGEIPSELTGMYTLAVFTVAFNNLSGRVPDMKAQFSTFSETSYEGNPFLCGPPLQKLCNTTTTPVAVAVAGLGEKLGIDPISFFASSAASYAVTLLGLVLVLYINPYWRRLWFDFVDVCLSFMLPFCSEAIYKTSNPCT